MTAKQTELSPEERREVFAREYVLNGGKIQAAAMKAQFPVASASVRGSEMMRRTDVQDRIAELLRERFITEGQKAHKIFIDLSKRSSQKDAVKLRAAKELMTLAGMFSKSNAAQQAADAEKREVQTVAEGYALLAKGVAAMLTVPGVTTGITFDEHTGAITVTSAEAATQFLTTLFRSFSNPKIALPAEPPIVAMDDEPEDEPEEDEEDWTAV